MNKEIAAAALVLALGVSGASAQILQVQGSATMYEMMTDPVNGILQSTSIQYYIGYVGTSYDHVDPEFGLPGEGALVGDAQEIAPMARFLTGATCHSSPNATAHAGCFRHSLYAVSVLAAESNDPAENCSALRWNATMPLPSGGTYTFQDWRTVLRVIYAGQTDSAGLSEDPCALDSPTNDRSSSPGSSDCGGEIRRTLVNTWGNMFVQSDGSNCTNGACTALRHAFRRDDVSGATSIFLDLLALSPGSIGFPRPFCNGSELQDNDPIRRQCAGNGFVNGEQVCKPANPANPTTTGQGLGLVLPILVPQNGGGALPFCAPNALGGATYGDVQMPIGVTTCPNGAPAAPTCKWPRRRPDFGYDCLAIAGDRPVGTPSTFDGRAYNSIVRDRYGSILNYQRRHSVTGAISLRPMTGGYYRIHQTRAMPGTTLPANTGCALNEPAQQMSCLVEASPCSIGFNEGAGTDVLHRKALGLRGIVPGSNAAIFPTKADIRLLLRPSRAGCSPDPSLNGGYEDRYPLSRNLYLCTVDGIPGFNGSTSWFETGTQTADQLGSQAVVADIFQDRAAVSYFGAASHIITLDDTGSTPIQFHACDDMSW